MGKVFDATAEYDGETLTLYCPGFIPEDDGLFNMFHTSTTDEDGTYKTQDGSSSGDYEMVNLQQVCLLQDGGIYVMSSVMLKENGQMLCSMVFRSELHR